MAISLVSIAFFLAGISSVEAWLFSWPWSSTSVDCGATGEFTLDAPFDDHWWELPKCPDEINPTFKVFTRNNQLTGKVISYDPWSIPSEFDESRRTLFVTHGFTDDADSQWIKDITASLLSVEDCNVVTIDWRDGAKVVNWFDPYDLPASNTRTVGAQTALVMEQLVAQGATWASMWCIGHSLGAHVCGSAGMKATNLGGTVGRVTGMDPAGPAFQGAASILVGINPSSAAFVDVIHTTTTFGMLKKLGHMDFYPSDGQSQDGCIDAVCGHSRAHKYFLESIATDCFLARETCTNNYDIPNSCTDQGLVAKMGFAAQTGNGVFRLDINNNAPFCKG